MLNTADEEQMARLLLKRYSVVWQRDDQDLGRRHGSCPGKLDGQKVEQKVKSMKASLDDYSICSCAVS